MFTAEFSKFVGPAQKFFLGMNAVRAWWWPFTAICWSCLQPRPLYTLMAWCL